MPDIRVKFDRGEEVRYISHLDLMKVFERALRRSRLPIAYSQGFNPHPQMVFGLPLSVGVTSSSEYADFELSEDVAPDEFAGRLNAQLTEGLRITAAAEKKTRSNIMKEIAGASYHVTVKAPGGTTVEALGIATEAFLSNQQIMTLKETKSGTREVDIRPMIMELRFGDSSADLKADLRTDSEAASGLAPATGAGADSAAAPGAGSMQPEFAVSMLVSAGSAANLKPELLLQAFSQQTGITAVPLRIHRTGLFVNREGRLVDPLDASVIQGT